MDWIGLKLWKLLLTVNTCEKILYSYYSNKIKPSKVDKHDHNQYISVKFN